VENKKTLGRSFFNLAKTLSEQIRNLQPPKLNALQRHPTDGPLSLEGTDWSIEQPFTSEIRAAQAYKWLLSQNEYAESFRYFVTCIEQRTQRPRQIALLKMQFLEDVAAYIGLALSSPGWQPRKFSIDEKKRAVSLASELLALIEQGIGPPNPVQKETLENSLSYFSDEMDLDKREYAGSTAGQEAMLIGLARSFYRLGLVQREIVNLIDTLSVVMGFTPNRRTVQRYVNKAISTE